MGLRSGVSPIKSPYLAGRGRTGKWYNYFMGIERMKYEDSKPPEAGLGSGTIPMTDLTIDGPSSTSANRQADDNRNRTDSDEEKLSLSEIDLPEDILRRYQFVNELPTGIAVILHIKYNKRGTSKNE